MLTDWLFIWPLPRCPGEYYKLCLRSAQLFVVFSSYYANLSSNNMEQIHLIRDGCTLNILLVGIKTILRVLSNPAVLALLKNIWLLFKSLFNNEVLRDLIVPVI
jgi:hypothetical protein